MSPKANTSESPPAPESYRFTVLTDALARTSAHTGHNALQELTRALGETLAAKRAHISRYSPDNSDEMCYEALWDGARVVSDGKFPIPGSASEQTLLKGEQFYWNDVGSRFPTHQQRYEKWGVCSYLGCPLIDANGKTIGVISVMFGPGAHDQTLAETVLRLFAIRASGELDRMLVDNERRQLEQALQSVVRGTADVLGAAFFNALVLELSRALGARAVYLTKINKRHGGGMERLAAIEDGKPLPTGEVILPEKSPTRETIEKGFVHIPSSLRGLYPDNPVFARLQPDSFLGIALRSSHGETLGTLTILSTKPLQDTELSRSMLAIFAARAATELERLDADAEVARIDQRLRHSQKLEALGTLSGGIAHDFNNILAGILGNTQLAQFDAGNPDVVRHHLALVEKGCYRARDLVIRILSFSRDHEPNRLPCSLVPVVHEALQLLQPGLRRCISLQTDFPDDDLYLLADPGQIHQIILNLGTNSSHAIGLNDGTIKVSAARLPQNDPLRKTHPEIRAEHTIRLSVQDDGTGIPLHLQDRIFEPFFTTKSAGKGSGLGLASVHGITHAHDGVIVLDSTPGSGATFHLCFPECAAPPEPTPAEETATAVPVNGKRLLFIDDESSISSLAEAALGHLGWEVVTFNDPLLGLACFEANPDAFTAVITDLSMPKLNGAELARAILSRRPDMPVLIITGYMKSREIEMARSVGARHVLSKPFNLESLSAALKQVIGDE